MSRAALRKDPRAQDRILLPTATEVSLEMDSHTYPRLQRLQPQLDGDFLRDPEPEPPS